MTLAATWFTQFLHPGRMSPGGGYWFWSGIGSDLGELTILVALLAFVRHRNCHVRGCLRLSWHPHPEHGHPVCRHHHDLPATADLAVAEPKVPARSRKPASRRRAATETRRKP